MSAPVGGVWAMKSGDFQPTNFASTGTGIQAALDYAGTDLSGGTTSDGGEVYIGPGEIAGITNLKMHGMTTLRGAGCPATVLTRDASATGPMLREYSIGEGNARGATHLIIKDMAFNGNGATGNGLDLGNGLSGLGTDTVALNSDATIQNVRVSNCVGDGFKLCSNTVMFSNLHAALCDVGIRTTFNGDNGDGSSFFYGIWSEGNTNGNLICEDTGNTFIGLHLEEQVAGNDVPSIYLGKVGHGGEHHTFINTHIYLVEDRTNLIFMRSGLSDINIRNLRVSVSTTQTWTSTFYHDAWGAVLGKVWNVSHFSDTRSTYGANYWWNSNTNAKTVLDVSGLAVVGLTSGKYPIASTAGLLVNGPTPLAGTKVYYVSDSSGGAVTRKLTFTDGILTAET